MADNIVLMPVSGGKALGSQKAQAFTELLAQTISQMDKQIELAEELLGADRAHLFVRAINSHIVDRLGESVQAQKRREQS
jgi:hypothetical protein